MRQHIDRTLAKHVQGQVPAQDLDCLRAVCAAMGNNRPEIRDADDVVGAPKRLSRARAAAI
jgi:hypothetical protein